MCNIYMNFSNWYAEYLQANDMEPHLKKLTFVQLSVFSTSVTQL